MGVKVAEVENRTRQLFRRLHCAENQRVRAEECLPQVLLDAVDLYLKQAASADWCGRIFQVFIKFRLPQELESIINNGATVLDSPVAFTDLKLETARRLQRQLQSLTSSADRGRR